MTLLVTLRWFGPHTLIPARGRPNEWRCSAVALTADHYRRRYHGETEVNLHRKCDGSSVFVILTTMTMITA